MIVIENIILALKSIRANPLRSALTLVGISVGIAAVLYVVALGDLTQQRIKKRLESMGTNVLMIRPEHSHSRGIRTGASVISLKEADAKDILENSPVIVATVPTMDRSGMVEFEDMNWNTRITGTTPQYEEVNNDVVVAGRYFTEAEMKQRARVCVLGATVHEKLFEEKSPIGEAISINGSMFTVIGLLGSKGEGWRDPDDQVYIPLTTAQERMFGQDQLSSILAQLKSADGYDEALFDIETILRRSHRLRPEQENDFRVRRQDFFLSTIQDTNKEIANFIIIIALVSLGVGGIGIANIMLVSVTERTREIGIRRAVGAKKMHIMIQFIMEAVILGILGGIIGVVGGNIFNNLNIGEEAVLLWNWVGYSFVICAGIGIFAGIYPSVRAANADVIEALRYE